MQKKILMLEDDGATRNLFAAILEKAGFAVQTCADGKEGIESFRARKFDLVITDISMPGMGGIEVIRLIRQESPTVPIIAMSGTDRSESFLSMADYYTADLTLQKPLDAGQLIAAVKKVLGA
jgi:two-component system chemotaxis response regulator CheY